MAYFIGTINSLILDGDRTQSVQLQKVEEAQAFCDQKRLSADLSRAIVTHIRYHCHYNFVFDENDLMSSLPPNLQHEVERQLGETVLAQLDFFDSFRKSPGSMQTLGQIAYKMRAVSCNEGYCIFKRGDRAKEIYIQRTGTSILDFHDGQRATLGRGDVVGERAVFSQVRKCTVVCSTFSEFYILPIQEVVQVLMTEYPTSFTRRWKAIVDDLKASNERFGERYVRSIDFSKAADLEMDDEPMPYPEDEPLPEDAAADPEAATTKLAPEDGAQKLVVEQRESESAGSRPQDTKAERGKVTQLVKSWPMFTRRNSVNRGDAILRLGMCSTVSSQSVCSICL